MTAKHACPLCTDTYDDRTDLRVHLEVNHRKSEIVADYLDRYDDGSLESPVDGEPTAAEEEPQAPSAD